MSLAEGVGFEPTVRLPVLLISSQMPLTTQPPFQHIDLIGRNAGFHICQFTFFFTASPYHPPECHSCGQAGHRWQKRPVAKLMRHLRSERHYARIRVRGKRIWKSFKTSDLARHRPCLRPTAGGDTAGVKPVYEHGCGRREKLLQTSGRTRDRLLAWVGGEGNDRG